MDFTPLKRRYRILTSINTSRESDGRRLLSYYHYYRLALATILFTLAAAELYLHLPARHSLLFATVAVTIAATALTGLAFIGKRWPPLYLQIHLGLLLDLFLLGLLIFTRDDLLAILAVPLLILTGVASVLFQRRIALAYAALGTLLVLFKQTLNVFSFKAGIDDYHTSGILGLGLFSAALIVSGLATRMRHTELKVESQRIDISNLDHVNRIVTNNLKIGVVTIDKSDRIKLINPTAEDQLALQARVDELPELLVYRLHQSGHEERKNERFPFEFNDRKLQIQVILLENGRLLLIDDETMAHRQSQELRFASLGRMAGEVAHEIRNPLSAIQHAAQILQEADPEEGEDSELLEIILSNSVRINDIIESILNLSRAGKPHPEILPIRSTTRHIVDTCLAPGEGSRKISLEVEDIEVKFDPRHLEQTLVNLCQNAMKYGKRGAVEPKIVLRSGITADGRCCLDIIDDGPGVPPQRTEQLFEPFASSDPKSSGLGLYISRRLCELNDGRLDHINDNVGHRFRITFPKLEYASE